MPKDADISQSAILSAIFKHINRKLCGRKKCRVFFSILKSKSEKQYFGFPVALNQNDQNEHKLRPEDITVCVTNLYNIQ